MKFTEEEAREARQQFDDRLRQIMENSKPRTITLSVDAAALFEEFTGWVEKWTAPGGKFESIRDFAIQLPGMAAQLGTTIAIYENIDVVELSRADFERGTKIAVWYAGKKLRGEPIGLSIEAMKRLFTEAQMPNAVKAMDRIDSRMKAKGV